MDDFRWKNVDARLIRIENKLDHVIELRSAIRWIKLLVTGAWAAIAALHIEK